MLLDIYVTVLKPMNVWVCGEREGKAEPERTMEHIRGKRYEMVLGIRKLGDNKDWRRQRRYGQIFKKLGIDKGKCI